MVLAKMNSVLLKNEHNFVKNEQNLTPMSGTYIRCFRKCKHCIFAEKGVLAKIPLVLEFLALLLSYNFSTV